MIADKAYSNSIIRDYLTGRGINVVIPQKSNEKASRKNKGAAGGRPPAFDAVLYKGRNVVERHFGLAKQWRGIATRYEKLAITYRATAVLCAVVAWLRNLGDTPWQLSRDAPVPQRAQRGRLAQNSFPDSASLCAVDGSDELDALGQGQLAGVVDGVGGPAHVDLPGI